MREYLYNYYYYDNGELSRATYKLDSIAAFEHDYKSSIYSFHGKEINLSGSYTYSRVYCKKGLFSWSLDHEDIVAHNFEKIPISDGLSISKSIDPLICKESSCERKMNVTVHVSESYSNAIYRIREKYEAHKDIFDEITERLHGWGHGASLISPLIRLKISESFVNLEYPGANIIPGNIVRFAELGMTELSDEYVEQLAFGDALLSFIKSKYNNSKEYTNETIWIGRNVEITAENVPELQSW